MTKQTYHLISPQIRHNACQAIMQAPEGYRVTISPKGRSSSQNAFSHAWYGEIAQVFPEDDTLGWKAYCKLNHGVPILVAEDEEFREVYKNSLQYLSYEARLKIMRFFPVTSLMNVKQLNAYAEAVQDDFIARGLELVVKQC